MYIRVDLVPFLVGLAMNFGRDRYINCRSLVENRAELGLHVMDGYRGSGGADVAVPEPPLG